MSADEKEETPSQPLGTSTGVFWQEEEVVAARLDLFRFMELLYEDETAAEAALRDFQDSLLADDQISMAADLASSPADTMKPSAYTACSHFGLSFDANWEGVGRVYREDGLSLWFPED